jgi:hypothetical protein
MRTGVSNQSRPELRTNVEHGILLTIFIDSCALGTHLSSSKGYQSSCKDRGRRWHWSRTGILGVVRGASKAISVDRVCFNSFRMAAAKNRRLPSSLCPSFRPPKHLSGIRKGPQVSSKQSSGIMRMLTINSTQLHLSGLQEIVPQAMAGRSECRV